MKRLIIVIAIFAIFLAFFMLNLGNNCDISLGFRTFSGIPVFLCSLFSFVLGMIFTLPLVFTIGKNRKNAAAVPPAPGGSKKLRWGRKSKEVSTDPKTSLEDEVKKEGSSYGID